MILLSTLQGDYDYNGVKITPGENELTEAQWEALLQDKGFKISIKQGHYKELSDKEVLHSSEKEDLKTTHAEEIEGLKIAHAEELKLLADTHLAEIKKLNSDNSQKVADIAGQLNTANRQIEKLKKKG